MGINNRELMMTIFSWLSMLWLNRTSIPAIEMSEDPIPCTALATNKMVNVSPNAYTAIKVHVLMLSSNPRNVHICAVFPLLLC